MTWFILFKYRKFLPLQQFLYKERIQRQNEESPFALYVFLCREILHSPEDTFFRKNLSQKWVVLECGNET